MSDTIKHSIGINIDAVPQALTTTKGLADFKSFFRAVGQIEAAFVNNLLDVEALSSIGHMAQSETFKGHAIVVSYIVTYGDKTHVEDTDVLPRLQLCGPDQLGPVFTTDGYWSSDIARLVEQMSELGIIDATTTTTGVIEAMEPLVAGAINAQISTALGLVDAERGAEMVDELFIDTINKRLTRGYKLKVI